MNLRPNKLEDIIGQTSVKERLGISIKACKSTSEIFPHSLFYGPAGTGKTTLAQAIANELGHDIEIGNGSNISSIKALLPYLMRLKENSILFIDEVHRLPTKVAEFLYVAVEDFRVDIGTDDQVSMELPKFTFLGATTNSGLIPKPLYDRFILKLPLETYSVEELTELVSINADKLKLPMDDEAKKIVASSSRSTPRIANNRLLWIRHYAIYHDVNLVRKDHILQALQLEGIDADGVDNNDRKYLDALKRHQPAGLNTLVSLTNISRDTIEDVVEPFLLNLHLIKKTTKGRVLV